MPRAKSPAHVTSLHVNGHTVALDCGMFQGRRQESAEKNRKLPLPIKELDAVVLSHAHIDHSGRLPFLVAEGYSKTIWATSATRDLCAIMLADSAHIQEKDASFWRRAEEKFIEPLYGMRHAVRTMELMVGVPYNKPFDVVPGRDGELRRCRAHTRLGFGDARLHGRRARRSGSSSPVISAAVAWRSSGIRCRPKVPTH